MSRPDEISGARSQRDSPANPFEDEPVSSRLQGDSHHLAALEDGSIFQVPPRSLTFINGLAIVLGIQIGSGIFSSPSAVLENVPSTVSALLVWVVAGALAWTGAASFIELGTLVPKNGGIQEYLRYCYGDKCACIATWSLIFIVKPCSMAIISLIFAEYLHRGIAFDHEPHVVVIRGIALIALGVTTFLNCIGTRISAHVANVFLYLKFLGLGLIVITGLYTAIFVGGPSPEKAHTNVRERWLSNSREESQQEESPSSLWPRAAAYTDAILAAMWTYSGWETLGFVGGELINPHKTLPRILNTAMTSVITLFVLANASYIFVIPADVLKTSNTIALEYGNQLFGPAGALLFCWIVSLSCLGALDVKIFTTGRLTLAAVERGYLPDGLDSIWTVMKIRPSQSNEQRHRDLLIPRGLQTVLTSQDQNVPISLMCFNCLLASVYILIGGFRDLIIFTGMVETSICLSTVAGVLVLRVLRRSKLLEENVPIYGTALANPITYCFASILIVARSAFAHYWQGVFLLCFLGIVISTRKLLQRET